MPNLGSIWFIGLINLIFSAVRLFAVASVLSIAFSIGLAGAAEVRMIGTTTADATLAKDVMRHVMLFAEADLGCTDVQLIEPMILPDYKPARVEAEGSAKTTYERWTITLCGKKENFLVALWPASFGGTMLRVQYPFQ